MSDEDIISINAYSYDSFLKVPPWFRQQILKIGSAKLITSNLTLYCDSDIVVKSAINQNTFASGIPYEGMGFKNINRWIYSSLQTLYGDGSEFEILGTISQFQPMGVTPEFLVPEVLIGLIEHCGHKQNWIQHLIENIHGFEDSWNEYSLYWIYYLLNYRDKYTYIPLRLYRFINAIEELSLPLDNEIFLVLQSAKLKLTDHSEYV